MPPVAAVETRSRDVDSSVHFCDVERMERLRQRLEELPTRLRAPLSAEQLTRLDDAIGEALPPSLREWLAHAGPGAHLDLDMHGLRLPDAPLWAASCGEWYSAEDICETHSWLVEQAAPDAVAVGHDGAGNTLFLRRNGADATVWFHDHERECVVQVGASFIEWAHAQLNRDIADPRRAHTVLQTWHLPDDPGDVDVIVAALREVIGPDVCEQRDAHGYPSVAFRLGESQLSASRSDRGDGGALSSVFFAHKTTDEGCALFERVADVVQRHWPGAESEREVI